MDWNALLSAALGAGFGGTLAGLLLKTWLDHRLTIERSELGERRQLEQKKRDASVAVADILAEWVRSEYTGSFTNEGRWTLLKTYWKGILSLDKSLLDVLLPSLAGQKGAVGSNELIVRARAVLLGLAEPDIKAEQLNNWLPAKS